MARGTTSTLWAAPALWILATHLGATDLKPATAQAWDTYTARAERRFAAEPRWLDAAPGRRETIRSGVVQVEPRAGRSLVPVSGGLIHDWIGAVFIPGVSLDQVVDLLRDYEHYSTFFQPTVRASATQSLSDREDTFRIRYTRQALFMTVVLEANYRLEYAQTGPCEWRSTARSASIREVTNADTTRERIGSPDDGSGFLWRSETLVDLEERDGGVYLEEETLGLSTTIPLALRWLVEPYVERLARGLATDWLRQTKEAFTGTVREVASLPRDSQWALPK